MRIFWALLSILIAAGVLFVMLPPSTGAGGTERSASPSGVSPAMATRAVPPGAPAELAVPAPASGAVASPVSAVAGAESLGGGSGEKPGIGAPAADAPASAAPPILRSEKGNESEVGAAGPAGTPAKLGAGDAEATTRIPSAATSSVAQPFAAGIAGAENPFERALGGGGEAVTLAEHAIFKGDKAVPSKALRKPDGSLLIDDRFVLTGSGTASEPYIVPWDLIVSAQETYKPRLGMNKLPQRVTMLDGKHVKIVGFIAFPITATSPKEALVMLNQWDGCCIGTPPTPYDAVEVKLAAAASPGQKLMTSGTITGVFRVDPYEDGGWLLGMYLMEDAKLSGAEGL